VVLKERMLRNGIAILRTQSKQRKLTVCGNHIAKGLSIHGGENTFCLDSACGLHSAGCTTASYVVRPGKVSPRCSVPSHIERPLYAADSKLSRFLHSPWLSNKYSIEIKSEQQIKGMRDACRYDCFAIYCT